MSKKAEQSEAAALGFSGAALVMIGLAVISLEHPLAAFVGTIIWLTGFRCIFVSNNWLNHIIKNLGNEK